jgi:opacity protein-like surface antigen
MKTSRWVAAIACVIALPAAVAAQETTTTTTTTTTTQAVQQTSPPPSAVAYPPDDAPYPIASHWLVSGSIGSDFENDADDPSVNFAGTAGWLYHGVIGGEFQANFTPDFNLNPAIVSAAPFLADEPSINSYMLNLIGAAPLMAGGQFQPYVSGGPGWFKMHGDTIAGDSNIDLDKTDTGWNIGAGLMGFLGQLGVRADLRYFRVSGSEFAGVDQSVLRSNHGAVVDDQEGSVNANLLSGISFWRGNVGVALRW